MSFYKNMHKLADQLEKVADAFDAQQAELEAAQTKVASAQAEAAEAKKQAKVAQAPKDEVALGRLAKVAADKLQEAGLIHNQQDADKIAAAILDNHETALSKLAECATYVQNPKLGSVVVDDAAPEQSSESVWSTSVRNVLARLPQ